MAADTPARVKRKASRRYTHIPLVEVHLWGTHMGSVALDPTYGFYVFAYTPRFSALGIEPSPLQMPTDRGAPFIFTDLPPETYKRLPAMLSDALPDDFGNALINRYMSDKGVAPSEVTALDRLAYMGSRAMGALVFKPTRGPAATKPTAIEMSALVDSARHAVTGVATTDDETRAALRSIIDVGTSAGGARAKAVIALHPQTHEMRSGQLDAPPGFEHWLLKFDGIGADLELGVSQGYGRIEYAYHLMARAAGIRMTDCKLLEENGRAHFMTKRFDREGQSGRHHLQTLCAMAHADYKKKSVNAYSQLFTTMTQLALPYSEMEEAFRRMAFNVMGRNCDDHTKNFSFLLRQGGSWELSPAYDVTFAHNPQGEWTNQHLMSVNGKFKDIGASDLLAEADRFGVGTAQRVLREVSAAIARWPEFAALAGLAETETRSIGAQHLLLG